MILIKEDIPEEDIKRFEEQYEIHTWIGAGRMLEKMRSAGVNKQLYHTAGLTNADSNVYGLLCKQGQVLAIQMPALDAPSEDQQDQIGWKQESRGRLLAGMTVTDTHVVDASGSEVLALEGSQVDTDGFVVYRNNEHK